MKFNSQTIQGWLIVIALFALVAVLAMLPVGQPAAPAATATVAAFPKVQPTGVPNSAGRFGATQFDGDIFFMGTNPRIVQGPGTLAIRNYNDTQDNLKIDQSGNVTLPSGGSITIGSDAFSGAAKHITATNVVSGSLIAHTLSTTPTIGLCQPNVLQATTYTQTIYAYSFNAVSATIGVSQGAVVTFTNVSCVFGK